MHRDQVYLCHWLGLGSRVDRAQARCSADRRYLGSSSSKLTATPPKMILLNAYNDPKAANWLAERVHAPAVVLPFSVGGTPEAKDLFGLFDDTLNRLLAAAK